MFLGWASCLMLPYFYRSLDCLFNIFSVWHLSKHPSSALQTLYAGNRSTHKWPIMWKLSCIDIIMAGPVKLETSGYLERWVFQNESHTAIWDRNIFGTKANKVGWWQSFLLIFIGFLISVRAKLHETFTVHTAVAFTRWPREAVKSTLLW